MLWDAASQTKILLLNESQTFWLPQTFGLAHATAVKLVTDLQNNNYYHMIGGNFNIRKWLRIRLAWRNSNKRVSLSFKRRGLWWLLFVSAWSLLVVRPTDWLLQLPGAVLLIGRAPFVYWGVSNYCALTEKFLLPRIQLCSLHRLSWLLLPYDYRHDYFPVSSMLKLSSLKPSKYTRWIFASIGRFVTI